MNWNMKAVYKDRNGYEYSTPVIKTANGWQLRTPLGDRDIEFYLLSADNSVIEFYEYRLEAPKGIRPVDYLQVLNAWLVQLPLPQKPSDPPSVQTEPQDSRIHIESAPAIPTTESSFARLKAAGNRAAEQYRANRERERQQLQETLNRADPQKVQQARNANNISAARMRPKRRGE